MSRRPDLLAACFLATSFERHDEFWIKSYFGKEFHVLSVDEGILVIALLCLATWVAVRWLRR